MRIALVSEGTYPFSVGGVSVWCDQLMQGMPEHEWEMVALTAGSERQRWAAPPNLKGVHRIPLWEPRPTGRGPIAAYRHARAGRGGRVPGQAFRLALGSMLEAMLRPAEDGRPVGAATFLSALRQIHGYADSGGDVGEAMVSDASLGMTVDAWRDYRDTKNGGDITLADAVKALWLLEHLLRPLFADTPRVDLVHSSMNGLSMLVAMAAKWRHGTPVVLSEHGIYLRERYLDPLLKDMPYPVKALLLSFYRELAGAGYLLTDALAPHAIHNRRWELLCGADIERIWTVYNGVEPSDFPPPSVEPDIPTIVFMGRIDPIKDLHTLIRAFALVRAKVPDARLRIFGDTTPANSGYRDSCVDLINELEIAGAATFEGRVARQADAYHQGHVVALTSISEGFPYTVVEAMACGRPVVCTDVGGVSEAVGEAGFMVPARDHKAVAEACVRLLRDPELQTRLGVAAHDRVLQNFTLTGAINVYRDLYDSVVPVTVEQPPAASVSITRRST